MDKTVVVICGPTASGKTEIASSLCEIIGGEIISADSRQVYRLLDAGTNKSGVYNAVKSVRETTAGIPQYLTDLINPDEIFNAGDFSRETNKLINTIKNAGKVPVIVGGTGLYIKAVVSGLAPMPEKNDTIRDELKNILKERGIDDLYLKLKAVDPVSAEKNRSNPQRLIRALEIFRLTGKPISYWHSKTVKPEWTFVQFAPLWKREELFRNIDERSRTMLKYGMIEETKKVISWATIRIHRGLEA